MHCPIHDIQVIVGKLLVLELTLRVKKKSNSKNEELSTKANLYPQVKLVIQLHAAKPGSSQKWKGRR
ncbi:hypothetical protein Bpfe_019778 [Biomphalaria pfeifferi]|uniref:Uncharacterized protein n=1 Tax=Biomphalaria pfeifferi TaxID=112525 RepID=A0AAD8BAW3_BIOPF|nr:hypothetical protein Bpfe_019778 [Biomphalaria pfeifferi]